MYNYSHEFQTEQFTVLWILFAVIVLGNSAVLVTLHLSNNQKSRMNFFIKQLAIAGKLYKTRQSSFPLFGHYFYNIKMLLINLDLCVGLLNVLTDIIWRVTVSWRAGNLACKFIRFMQVSVTYASTYVLVALSIDRYDAITHPMNFSGSCK